MTAHDDPEIIATLRQRDPERYGASLYLPQPARKAIITLYAFNAEIAGIASRVSEPLPGEIRLQWWRDVLGVGDPKDGVAGAGSPLSQALLGVIEAHDLPLKLFADLIDARVFDLYHDPMPDQGSFEGYLGETRASLFNVAGRCVGGEFSPQLAEAAGHAGMAYGIMELLANLARDRASERIYIPSERLRAHGLEREEWLNAEIGPAHRAVVTDMINMGHSHLDQARQLVSSFSKSLRTAFLPLVFVEPVLSRAERDPHLFSGQMQIGPLRRQWLPFQAVLRNKI